MTSPKMNDIDPDLQPQPVARAPMPMQRTSSPNRDTFFFDPLLSLTPDKPSRPAVGAQGHEAHNERRENTRTKRPENTDGNPPQTRKGGEESGHDSRARKNGHNSRERTSGNGSRERKNDVAVSSRPEVLFQQQRTMNQKALLEKNLKIIRHESKSMGSKPVAKNDDRSKENKVAIKFDKLTRPSKSSIAQTSAAKTGKKAAILKSSREQHGAGRSKKHVRIVDEESPLSAPEPHSTVVLGQQIADLKSQTFDPEEVVLKTLQDSESARRALNEKVAGAANFGKTDKKYSALVSLNIPVDEVIQRAVTQRTSRGKNRPPKPTKSSEVPLPDILEMFSPSMIVESANLNASGLGPAKVKPAPADPDMTFDLYRHMQCWDLGH